VLAVGLTTAPAFATPHPSRARARQRDPHARLAAIRSLFRYTALRHPEHAATIQRVLAIPAKRHDQALVTFLTDPELQALLDAPDLSTWIGRRDHAMILLAAQTGLRASELIGRDLRRPAARDRRSRQHRRQGPQTAHHATDQPDRHGHARMDPRARRPNRQTHCSLPAPAVR
jgi:integrase